MLNLTQQEPFWLDILPGQRTQFRPVETPMILAARHQAALAMRGAETVKDTDPEAFAALRAKSDAVFTTTLARFGIVAWEGVGDGTNSVEPTPANIKAYMANWRVFDSVDKLYVLPAIALDQADEKNASAPSQNGTGGAKMPEKDIAAPAAPSTESPAQTALTS